MDATKDRAEVFRAKLNMETAQIAWKELQRFFASGVALIVSADLDLVEVAFQVSEDNSAQIKLWMESGKLAKVADVQAEYWLKSDTQVWAVVVRPWVLVQPVRLMQ